MLKKQIHIIRVESGYTGSWTIYRSKEAETAKQAENNAVEYGHDIFAIGDESEVLLDALKLDEIHQWNRHQVKGIANF